MKKRAARLIALLLLPLLLLLPAFFLPAQYGRTYLAALNDKAELLDRAPSPRIVLIGGSGAAFDTDCGLLEEQLPGYTAVNFGLYAGLGVPVMLEVALPALREGDVVILSPELSGQTLSDWFGAESMWQAAEENPALLLRLDPSRWGDLLAAFPRFAAQKTRFFLEGNAPEGEGVYARASFDGRGDVLPGLRPANRMPGGRDENMPLRFDEALPSRDFVRRVNAFCDACAGKGVKVFFRFCPMNAAALAEGETERIAGFASRLRKLLRCEIIGSAERALMDAGWFFDTNFHLNGAGAVLNTVRLAEDLKAALGDFSPVTAVLPERPGMALPGTAEGDNTDEACFEYLPRDGGLIASGLTEEGRSRDKLTVPASSGGLPVISFAREVFAGNVRVREVVLQGSIRAIPDGAFEGCAALRTVTLLQEDPGLCAVGKNLLTGTDAAVAVPAARYGAYCTNYFWAPYATRLRPLEDGPQAPPARAETAAPPVRADATHIRYEGNGGALRGQGKDSLTREITYAHLRENTLQGTVWFDREGWVLTGWNTLADGSGRAVGLGSRTEIPPEGTLYAQWMPCSPEEDFEWETGETAAAITGYRGDGGICVLPRSHEGLPVRTVREGAFEGKTFSLLVLSPSLRTVEEGAFRGCGFGEMILYDSLETVSDACFPDCAGPSALRVNAATAPVYSGSYFDTFQDKYDFLLSVEEEKKLVLFSGSSGRYGYDSELLRNAFPDRMPVNMGVYAWTNALPQLMLILPRIREGDILLDAPEFDAVEEQFCVSDRLDAGFWAMMESNYDAAAGLDMRRFNGVFDSLGEYLAMRRGMPGRDYTVSPAHYDDDGNPYDFRTYNRYGDFTLPRPLGEGDGRLRSNIADYTPRSFSEETVRRLNAALLPFVQRGAAVFFTYTPRNINSLTEESTPDARAALDRWLRETLDVPVISGIEDSLLPGRYFWLIDSHTGTEGARIRTEQVIRDLRAALDSGRAPDKERSQEP